MFKRYPAAAVVAAMTVSTPALASDLVLMNDIYSPITGEPVPSLWRDTSKCFVVAEAASTELGTIQITIERRSCTEEDALVTDFPIGSQSQVPAERIEHGAGQAVNVLPAGHKLEL